MRLYVRIFFTWILVAFIGDTIVAPLISIRGISPDFSIIALVILALATSSRPATIGGFMLGLVQDLSNPSLLGLRALCKCGLGYAISSVRGRLVHGMPVVEGALVALSVLAHDFLFLLVQSRMGNDAFVLPLMTQTLPVALYSALVGIVILRMADFAGILQQEE